MLKALRRSASKKDLKEQPFLHVKFGDGKAQEFGHVYRFAHQISLIPPSEIVLPDGLSTDVQREVSAPSGGAPEESR